ncbi:MAG: hypothetical protein V7L21_08585 [Nostoc sp.]|uniref:hypothetical protein n=1 Tax=Nostoc sp. TaxID=1180 RepID=UPI002FF4F510
MIISTEDLKKSILERSPKADISIIEELCALVIKYKLKWFPCPKTGHGAFFIMSQVSVAKELDVDDYRRNWSTISTSGIEHRKSETLAGKDFKIEGDILKDLKSVYEEFYPEDKSLVRVPSLIIGDWKRVYAYIIQGSTQAAKDFQNLGAKAIQLKVEEEIQKPVLEVTNKHIYQSGYAKEDHLARDLCYLSAMTPYTLKCERSFPDFPGSKTKVRRFDLIHSQPHKTKKLVITCYELKRNIVDYHDLVDTVEAKRYIEVLKKYFNTEHVNLIMVAPFGGSKEALDKAQQYDNVEVWTTRKLTLLLLEKARAYHKLDNYFVDNLEKECDTVKKLLIIPQVIEQPANILPFEKPIKKIIA